MKRKKLLVVVLSSLASLTASGQKPEEAKSKKIKITDYFLQSGYSTFGNNEGSLSDFKTLAPESTLLTNNLNDFSQSGKTGIGGGYMFSTAVGIQFNDKKNSGYKANPLLRLGVTYVSGTSLSALFSKEVRKPYDTLTSAQTGQLTYVDSVNISSYSMNYTSDQLRLDGSLLFRTNPSARWSAFTGIGFATGISLRSYTTIFYYNEKRTESDRIAAGMYSPFYFEGVGALKTETFKNKMNFSASVYVPLGVDFRVGKKRDFWKRMHVFYEMRPGVNITAVSELRTVVNTSLQQGVGLRFECQ